METTARLSILLFIQIDDTFHWGLLLETGNLIGKLYHITNSPGQPYVKQVYDYNGLKSARLIAALAIGNIPLSMWHSFHDIVWDTNIYPRGTPSIPNGTTCRTWVLEAISRLDTRRHVEILNLDNLEGEAFALARYSYFTLRGRGGPQLRSSENVSWCW